MNLKKFISRFLDCHFRNRHTINLSPIMNDLNHCHEFKCKCGKEFRYVPYSELTDHGVISDENGMVYKYVFNEVDRKTVKAKVFYLS